MNKVTVIRYLFILVLCVFIINVYWKERRIIEKYINYKDILYINEIMINNRNSIRDRDGDFSDWIEIYNESDEAIHLDGFGLTDNEDNLFKWKFDNITIEADSYLLVWASGKDRNSDPNNLHTNFSLSTKDSVLVLTSPDGSFNDIVLIEASNENISYGRKINGNGEFVTFQDGTPRKSNNTQSLVDGIQATRLLEPQFLKEGGIYPSGFWLEMICEVEGGDIYYTMDGTSPSIKSTLYRGPIYIEPKESTVTVIRAVTAKEGYQDSIIVTHSYFVNPKLNHPNHIPIVSIVTDPYNLFDYKKGIYVPGRIYDEWLDNNSEIIANIPANYTQKGKEWEREAHIEIFRRNNKKVMDQEIGIRISGGFSRAKIIKSLSLYARKDYDEQDYFYYDFTDKVDSDTKRLSKLVLRTPSTDALGSFFRDDLIQGLIPDELNLETQKSNTCLVFINGEYYGIHSIKEAYNKEYFYSYYNVPLDEVVVLKNPTGTAGTEISEGYVGDEMHFSKMYSFIAQNDMSIQDNYDYIDTLLDTENFIEYNILQIYAGNRDWPGNNVKAWRRRTDEYDKDASYGMDGRWRWLVFDLDYGLGLYSKEHSTRYDFDMLTFATTTDGPIWPNPPWSTVMLRKLLYNQNFKNQFINTFADRLNTIYSEENVLKEINSYKMLYMDYVPEHIKRWDIFKNDITLWENEIKILENFAKHRPSYVREHISNYFNLDGTYQLRIEIEEGGYVNINKRIIIDDNFQGIYFKEVDVYVEAIAKDGYEFIGWFGDKIMAQQKIVVKEKDNINLVARFQKLDE